MHIFGIKEYRKNYQIYEDERLRKLNCKNSNIGEAGYKLPALPLSRIQK